MSSRTTKVVPRKTLERRIVQSYIWVLRAPKDSDGLQAASLARHGAYEVRLFDPSVIVKGDSLPFWIELFDHKDKTSLDSYGSDDIEDATVAAEAMISQAELLHQSVACRAQ
jgi:hypothetical protein